MAPGRTVVGVGGAAGHLFGEGLDGAGVVAPEGVGHIVGAFEHEAVEHLPPGEALAGLQVQAALADFAVFEGHLHFLVEVAGFDDEEGGHDLRGAGGELRLVGVLFVKGRAGEGVDDDGPARGEGQAGGVGLREDLREVLHARARGGSGADGGRGRGHAGFIRRLDLCDGRFFPRSEKRCRQRREGGGEQE